MANNAESISITWRVHDLFWLGSCRDDRLQIQSSAVTTRSNTSKYCIYHHRNCGRISIRGWTNKKHHIPRHNGQAMGCLSWVFLRDWPCYNGTTVYVLLGTRSRKRFLFRFPSAKNVKWSALLTLCEGNPQITIGRPQQMANNAESISMTWRVHDIFDWGHILGPVWI